MHESQCCSVFFLLLAENSESVRVTCIMLQNLTMLSDDCNSIKIPQTKRNSIKMDKIAITQPFYHAISLLTTVCVRSLVVKKKRFHDSLQSVHPMKQVQVVQLALSAIT